MGPVSRLRAIFKKDAVGIWGVVIGAASLIVSVFAVIVSIFAIQAARELAMESGSLDRPDLRLGLGTFEVIDRNIDVLFFVDRALAEQDVVITADLPLTIVNEGASFEEDIIVLIQYFRRAGFSPGFGDVASDLMEGSGPIQVGISREVIQSEAWLSINYKIDEIRPGVSIGLAEPFILPHEIKVSAPVTLADGVKGSVDLRIDFGISIPVLLSRKNGETMSYNLSVSTMVGQDDERERLNRYANRIQEEYRERMNFFEYLISGIAGAEHSFYHMKQTSEPYISDDGIHLFTREAELLSFSLFNKRLLF